MKKIIMKRGHGKTYQLIKLSSELQNYIVCRNKNEAHMIMSMAKELNFNIPQPITYQEFINKQYYGQGIKGFLIDNAEYLLQSMTSVPINAISITP